MPCNRSALIRVTVLPENLPRCRGPSSWAGRMPPHLRQGRLLPAGTRARSSLRARRSCPGRTGRFQGYNTASKRHGTRSRNRWPKPGCRQRGITITLRQGCCFLSPLPPCSTTVHWRWTPGPYGLSPGPMPPASLWCPATKMLSFRDPNAAPPLELETYRPPCRENPESRPFRWPAVPM